MNFVHMLFRHARPAARLLPDASFRFCRPFGLVLLAFLLIFPFALVSPVRAASPVAASFTLDSPLVRVMLTRASVTTLVLWAQPGARLLGPEGRERAAGMGPWTITLSGRSAQARDATGRDLGMAAPGTCWRLQAEDAETLVGISSAKGAQRRYRGCLEIGAAGGRLRVINEVPLESYLRGVVICEMGGNTPPEAMKAQAIASRTYALYSLLETRTRQAASAMRYASRQSDPRWSAESYDVRDNTDSQVYGGMDSETPDGDRAVFDTNGLILTAHGTPIFASFCADCGGATTPGAHPDDCPHSVSDIEAHGGAEAQRRPTWTLTYTPERLAALLAKQAALRGLGALETMEITEKDVSNRVRRLRLTWRAVTDSAPPADPFSFDGEEDTLFLPALPPILETEAWNAAPPVFREITGNTLRTLLGLDTLRSTLFTVQRDTNGDFVVEGRGWGHGRGMCQVGAKALAAPPFSRDCRAILMHYYGGATLAHLVYPEEEYAAPTQAQAMTARREGGHGR